MNKSIVHTLNMLWDSFKVFIPMKRYMKTKKTKYVEKFLEVVFSEKDDFAFEYLSKVLLYFNMDFTPIPIINKEEAQSIKTPITLIAAEKDIMFPGMKMLKRAVKIFPSLKEAVLLKDSKHVQSKHDNKKIAALIMNK